MTPPEDPPLPAQFRLLPGGKAGGKSHGVQRVLELAKKNDKGGIHPILINAIHILNHDPAVAGMFGFNEFTGQPVILRAPPPSEDEGPIQVGPFPRPWGLPDIAFVQGYLQQVWATKFARTTIEEAMAAVASINRFHPVRDWLEVLEWDGTSRLGTWLHQSFGCADNNYHNEIGTKILIAAVRRVRQPGCKFDYLLVLEGDQGIGKSAALKTLFSADWFTDSVPGDLGNKDAAIALSGVWCVELSEIEQLIRTESATVKAFLSRGVDHYRPPYGRQSIDVPRQSVLIGTTNENDYLRDVTGNRRIWPAKCGKKANTEWLEKNRDQLWAEAAAYDDAKIAIWIDQPQGQEEAVRQQAGRVASDPWDDEVRRYIQDHTMLGYVRIPEILRHLSVETSKQDGRGQDRIAKILRREGWERNIDWIGDGTRKKTTRVWVPIDNLKI